MTQPDALRSALPPDVRRAAQAIVDLQDHHNGEPWSSEFLRGYNKATANALTVVEALGVVLAAIPSEVDVERLARAIWSIKKQARLDIVANDANGDMAMSMWPGELAVLVAAAYNAEPTVKEGE